MYCIYSNQTVPVNRSFLAGHEAKEEKEGVYRETLPQESSERKHG